MNNVIIVGALLLNITIKTLEQKTPPQPTAQSPASGRVFLNIFFYFARAGLDNQTCAGLCYSTGSIGSLNLVILVLYLKLFYHRYYLEISY